MDAAASTSAARADPAPDPMVGLVAMLLVSGGPMHIPLADSWPLHRAIITAAAGGLLPGTIAGLGHRPDPVTGRRADRIDRALRDLAAAGALVPVGDGWRLARAGRVAGRAALSELSPGDANDVRRIAERWCGLAGQQARRRDARLPTDGPAGPRSLPV